MKQIDITAPIRVAVLLPLRVGNSSDRRYLEFYQGVLLALDELKSTGVSTQVDLFNTGRSEAEVRDLLRQNAVQQADLIIGPVYDDCFAPVAVFAAERGIPVVSPLASMNFAGGSLMFEAAPLQSAKYAKLQDEFSPSNNVVVVSATSNNDAEMLGEINSLLPASARKVTYTKVGRHWRKPHSSKLLHVNRIITVVANFSPIVIGILAVRSLLHEAIRSLQQRQFAVIEIRDELVAVQFDRAHEQLGHVVTSIGVHRRH